MAEGTRSRSQPGYGDSSLRSDASAGAEPSAECAYCFATDFSPNVECWETYDVLVCDDCADQAHEDNDQFGAGA